MLDQTHSTVSWPALLVVVADYILVVWIWILCQESLDEVTRVFFVKLKDHEYTVDVAHVKSNWVPDFSLDVLVIHELIWLTDRPGKLERTLLSKNTQVQDKTIVLEYKACELEAPDETIRVRVAHVLVRNDHVVLGRHVVGQIVIHDQPQ